MGPTGPYTVSCRTAHRAWVQALHLVVEMQNALAADYSLQASVTTAGEAPSARGLYKLSRAAETHYRFLQHYQRVLEAETLPGLWRISQGLFAPDMSPDWMSLMLSKVRAGGAVQRMDRLALDLFQNFSSFCRDMPRLACILDTFRAADFDLLAGLKRVLADGVRVFERHQRRTRTCGAGELRRACEAALAVFEGAATRLGASMGPHLAAGGRLSEEAAPKEAPVKTTRRLYSSAHWIFEDQVEQNLAVLERTPVAWDSLAQLSQENERILVSLCAHQRAHGLLVDMRQAPIRNDAGFENAMAKLREGLTSHFKRTAILLESNLGELQVTRIERDERRNALATRSESTARKFLLGGK
jgi:hypothetical protein